MDQSEIYSNNLDSVIRSPENTGIGYLSYQVHLAHPDMPIRLGAALAQSLAHSPSPLSHVYQAMWLSGSFPPILRTSALVLYSQNKLSYLTLGYWCALLHV